MILEELVKFNYKLIDDGVCINNDTNEKKEINEEPEIKAGKRRRNK